MKKIEMLFLAQRRRVKITPHIEELAKKDAEWFKELYIEAKSGSEAIHLATNGNEEYEWDDLPELQWEIESVELQSEAKYSSEEV